MKSNKLIQFAGILSFLSFFALQQATAQGCNTLPAPLIKDCWAASFRNGNTHFVNADLSGANLRGLTVGYEGNFQQANLSKAVFRGTDFPHCDFTGANLSNADFRGMDMKFANLVGANLTGTLFDGADLMNAKVSRKTTKGIADFDAFAEKYFVRIED